MYIAELSTYESINNTGIILSCELTGYIQSDMIEWFKDGDPIMTIDHRYYIITSNHRPNALVTSDGMIAHSIISSLHIIITTGNIGITGEYECAVFDDSHALSGNFTLYNEEGMIIFDVFFCHLLIAIDSEIVILTPAIKTI